MRRFWIVVSLAAMLPAAGRAADCYDSPVQADLNACAGADFAKADAALNAAYKIVHDRLSADGQTRLRDAERAWIAFRDAECNFRSSGDDGGSAAVMIDVQCQAYLTNQRAEDLNKMKTCEDGDLSCPR